MFDSCRQFCILAIFLLPIIEGKLGADIFCSRAAYTQNHCTLVVDNNGNTVNDLILKTFNSCAASASSAFSSSNGLTGTNSASSTSSDWNFTLVTGNRRLRVSEDHLNQQRELAICDCCTLACQYLGVCGSSCNLCSCKRRLEKEGFDKDFVEAMENRELEDVTTPRRMFSPAQRIQSSCQTSMENLASTMQQQGNLCLGDPSQLACTVTTGTY